MKRALLPYIQKDLLNKMVFLGGPRQVGKTTLSFALLKNGSEKHPAYFNWDYAEDKNNILKSQFPTHEKLLIFDEIHKYKDWRNFVKGLYDKFKKDFTILVTGSCRLDYYRRSGDSLLGRYHYYRLHPLHLDEISDLTRLLKFGGFPEPYLKEDVDFLKRWHRERKFRVLQEDLLSIEHVKEVSQLDLLMDLLTDRVGSILSIPNLKNDLSVAYETVDRWIQILSNLYYCYLVAPYSPSKIKSVKKEKKMYLWDWSQVIDEGARFENFVGSLLLKYCQFIEDTKGDRMELCFLKDKDKREIDFILVKNRNPLWAIECKLQFRSTSKHLVYFKKKLEYEKISGWFQIHAGNEDIIDSKNNIRICPIANFAKEYLKTY